MRAGLRQPRVASDVDVVQEDWATFLNRFNGDGWRNRWITGAQARAAKRFGLIAVGFGASKLAVGGTIPKVGAAGMEEGASEDAERPDEMAGIAALESGLGKLQKKFLESLVRLRRVSAPRISTVNCQYAPFA
jgi:hypothetical protein